MSSDQTNQTNQTNDDQPEKPVTEPPKIGLSNDEYARECQRLGLREKYVLKCRKYMNLIEFSVHQIHGIVFVVYFVLKLASVQQVVHQLHLFIINSKGN